MIRGPHPDNDVEQNSARDPDAAIPVAEIPRFSIVISTFNREHEIRRCIDSSLAQTFHSFEVIVVDDASTDRTLEVLREYSDTRLRVISHAENRGINPSRHTGVANALGVWMVVVDSDWELLPDALDRLSRVIIDLPEGVGAVRGRLRWENGGITPQYMPHGPTDYLGRVRWVDDEGGHDAARCIRRDVLMECPYFSDRRGAMESLFELNLARATKALYIEDVLGIEHTDALNSNLREVDRPALRARLAREAEDRLWMAETILSDHGAVLRRDGPRQYQLALRVASQQAFLLGRRRLGTRYSARAIRHRPADALSWASLALGLVSSRALADGMALFRRVTV